MSLRDDGRNCQIFAEVGPEDLHQVGAVEGAGDPLLLAPDRDLEALRGRKGQHRPVAAAGHGFRSPAELVAADGDEHRRQPQRRTSEAIDSFARTLRAPPGRVHPYVIMRPA